MKYYLLLSLLIPFSIQAQTAHYFEMAAPNGELQGISIPSFSGKPIFGSNMIVGGNPQAGANNSTEIKLQLNKYLLLVQMRYLAPFFDVMRTDEPTWGGPNLIISTKATDSSSLAQRHLLKVANRLLTEQSFPKYLCKKGEKCKPNYGMEYSWGGVGADEFASRETFQSFIANNLAGLRKWAGDVTTDCYLLTTARLSTYDFDKKAFSLSIHPGFNLNLNLGIGKYTLLFNPQNDFESWMMTKSNQPKSFPGALSLTPDEGRSLLERLGNQRTVYVLYQIRIIGLEKKSTYTFDPVLTYQLTDPNVVIYEDAGLMRKIGEMEIQRPVGQKDTDEKATPNAKPNAGKRTRNGE